MRYGLSTVQLINNTSQSWKRMLGDTSACPRGAQLKMECQENNTF